eukprot:4382603-Prymnesium_polylepis.1
MEDGYLASSKRRERPVAPHCELSRRIHQGDEVPQDGAPARREECGDGGEECGKVGRRVEQVAANHEVVAERRRRRVACGLPLLLVVPSERRTRHAHTGWRGARGTHTRGGGAHAARTHGVEGRTRHAHTGWRGARSTHTRCGEAHAHT